jgi:hypothetical protein
MSVRPLLAALVAIAAAAGSASIVEWSPSVGESGTAVAGATSTTAPADAPRLAPLTPTDPNRISREDAAAIVALGRGTAGPPSSGHDHGHGQTAREVDVALSPADATTFAAQWEAAVDAVPRYDTIAKVAALGYVRASTAGPGVGTHWVKWSLFAKPFDPAQPSMVLFDESVTPPVLVGYSYMLQSATAPEGFAGPNDVWHQHTGLCVVNGWVDREESTGQAACAGTYMAGGDLWMLHAWVVPGYENRLGRFVNANLLLCPKAAGTPDFLRCGDPDAV